MFFFKSISFSFFIFIFTTCIIHSDTKIEHKIAVIVNEEMITSFDIIQRMKLSAILNRININNQNNQIMINNAVDELIHEKLKKEKINEYEMSISENEYIEFENNFFRNNNLEKNALIDILEVNNVKYSELRDLLENEILWNKLINNLYFRLTSVSDMEIDEIISKNPNITLEQAKNLVIKRQLDLKSSKMLRDMLNEATVEYK